MNSKHYRYLLAVAFLSTALACRAQQKNILFVRFEQKHFKQSELPADAFFSVFYRLQCKKPCNFHGFDARMVFETSKITVIPKNSAKAIFAEGSVSEGSDISSYINGELRVLVDASQMFDTTNHLLFQYRTQVKSSLADSAVVIPTRFDVLDGIDTVIIENAPGRDEVAWFQFAVAYLDSEVVIPPKKWDVTISQDSIAIEADSIKEAIVALANVDSAKVTSGVFTAIVDTSIIEVDTIQAVATTTTLVQTIKGDSIKVEFTSSVSLQSGAIWKVLVHAKGRKDTISTVLRNPNLHIGNSDNLVNSILYKFDSITVLGQAPKDTMSTVEAPSRAAEDIIVKYEAGQLKILSRSSDVDRIRIFSLTGALVYSKSIGMTDPAVFLQLSNGCYIAEIATRSKQYRKLFIVVH